MSDKLPPCRIEIRYIDPEVYTTIVNHEFRKRILRALFEMTLHRPVSKQKLAEKLGAGYHQLVYQLNSHLRDFWVVSEEQKVRGTRMELIEPANRHAVYITIGKERSIHMIDPIADIFGPVAETGVRCDSCSPGEVEECVNVLKKVPEFNLDLKDAEIRLLENNKRFPPFRPIDLAVISALRGIAVNEKVAITIPCERCAFLKRIIKIEDV